MSSCLDTETRTSFKKGMTLSQYMQQFDSEQKQNTSDQIFDCSQDLYQTCLRKGQKVPSTKLIPFNIPQMDEDNYQSSVDYFPQTPIHQSQLQELDSQKQTPKFRETKINISQIQLSTLYNQKKLQKTDSALERQHSKEYRIKHQSNSPFKKEYQRTPTKPNFSKTLYGNTFLANNLSNMSTASSTLYQSKFGKIQQKQKNDRKSLKGTIHSRQSKNEKYFHTKNKRQLDNIIQYQNAIRNKYNQKINLLDIRIDGFRDKLYERKNKIMP